MPGLGGLPPSFLSIDTDGRVLHLESLSKWICPGPSVCSCGWWGIVGWVGFCLLVLD